MCGRVIIDELAPDHEGANRHSNNTGEISALIKAAKWIINDIRLQSPELESNTTRRVPERDGYLVRFDSMYVAAVCCGIWEPKTTIKLVRHARRRNAEAVGLANVAFVHIKAHAGHYGNEKADRLADMGRGEQCDYRRAPYPQEMKWEFCNHTDTRKNTDSEA
jgi:ribonuclease HI